MVLGKGLQKISVEAETQSNLALLLSVNTLPQEMQLCSMAETVAQNSPRPEVST